MSSISIENTQFRIAIAPTPKLSTLDLLQVSMTLFVQL